MVSRGEKGGRTDVGFVAGDADDDGRGGDHGGLFDGLDGEIEFADDLEVDVVGLDDDHPGAAVHVRVGDLAGGVSAAAVIQSSKNRTYHDEYCCWPSAPMLISVQR